MKVKIIQLAINKTSIVSDFIFKSTSYDNVKHHKQKNTLIFSLEIRKKYQNPEFIFFLLGHSVLMYLPIILKLWPLYSLPGQIFNLYAIILQTYFPYLT